MVGRVFMGRYEVVRLLGEGGMGRVYLARQADLGRQVVVKVMHDNIAFDPKFRERFQRETLLMARFQHPYAVTLYDACLDDAQGACIVMEYIKGETLDDLLQRNGRFSPERVGRLLGQLCEVLQTAHDAGIVHRDLKPANLMVVDPDTPHEIIKVMDFGLAKLMDRSAVQKGNGSSSEFAIGTPGYMSPEQARGEEGDHRSDIYSVGVILYELLTGQLPFSGGATMDVLVAHATESPPPFAMLGASEWVPPAIEAVVQACLAKDPAQRPACARDLAEYYQAALARAPAPRERPSSSKGARLVDVPTTADAELVAVAKSDPYSVIHEMEAWMPEQVAAYKLRGFVQDVGGELLECVPGKIRVRLGGKGSFYEPRNRKFSWLGLGRRSGLFDMELRLKRARQGRDGLLRITMLLRPLHRSTADDEWPARCARVFCDLRGYLIGSSNGKHNSTS